MTSYPIPSVSFSPANLVAGHTSILAFTPTGASQAVFACKLADYDGRNELLRYRHPDAAGVRRTRKLSRVGTEERLQFETSELKKVVTLMAGKIKKVLHGKAEAWIRDPDDDTDEVALYVEEFDCALYVSDDAKRFEAAASDDGGTKCMLVVESLDQDDLVIHVDADTSVPD